MAAAPLCGAALRHPRRSMPWASPPRKRCGGLGRVPLGEDITYSTLVVDRERQPAAALHHQGRLLAPAGDRDDVDPRFLAMLIAYEDKRFYDASAASTRMALLRAAWQALTQRPHRLRRLDAHHAGGAPAGAAARSGASPTSWRR